MYTVRVKGVEELEAKFERLPEAVRSRVLGPALRAGAVPVQHRATANAPKRSGKLARSIKTTEPIIHANSASIRIVAGHDWYQGQTFYGGFVEFGWRAGKRVRHAISLKARIQNRLRRKVRGRFYMRGAWRDAGPEAVQITSERIRDGILKEAARGA